MKNCAAKNVCVLALVALSGLALRAQTHSGAAADAAPRVTHIASDSADFDLGAGRHQAVYRGHVRVDDPEMKLSCEWLVADLPPAGGRVDRITAETNVVIDFTDGRGQTNQATSDKAVYVYAVQNGATNETVTLTGHAQVENAQMTLTGEPIIWNRATGTLTATNQQMTLRQSLTNPATNTIPPAATTNNLAAPR